ncbi:hypothetical protein ACFL60_03100 [Candidatus Omnitrophota bacterium]
MTEKRRKLVSIFELTRLKDTLSYTYQSGSKPSDFKIIARVFTEFAQNILSQEVHKALISEHLSVFL